MDHLEISAMLIEVVQFQMRKYFFQEENLPNQIQQPTVENKNNNTVTFHELTRQYIKKEI